MVEIPDIKDEESLRAWLQDQPHEVSVWIAFRMAARVLPDLWLETLEKDWLLNANISVLPTLYRQILLSAAVLQDNSIPSKTLIFSAESYIHYKISASKALTSARSSRLAYDTNFPAVTETTHHASRTVTYSDVTKAAKEAAKAVAFNTVSFGPGILHAIKTDAEQAADGTLPDALPLWPDGPGPLADQWAQIKTQIADAPDAADWQFWIEWYDALLAGRTMLSDPKRTWDMIEEIALIEPATWDAGPETVNPEIRKIWESYKANASASAGAADPEPVSDDAKSAMKQRIAVNRDALVMASAGVLEQLGTFKEQVRGMNHLEPELREEVLAFIDEFSGKLSSLIHGLPVTGTVVDDDQAGRLVLWLREYRGLLRHKLAYYGSADNMADATVPTGIILGATGIGAMLGMPVAGSVVGGLIVNQMKPGQAAKELTKPQEKDLDQQ